MSYKKGWEFNVSQINKYSSFEIIDSIVKPIPCVAIRTPITKSIVTIDKKLLVNRQIYEKYNLFNKRTQNRNY